MKITTDTPYASLHNISLLIYSAVLLNNKYYFANSGAAVIRA